MQKEFAPVQELDLSPYSVFTETEWASLRADTPMTLSMHEIEELQSLNDYVSQEQVKNIYLPLSRLLAYYVEASQSLQFATKRFFGYAADAYSVHHWHRGFSVGRQVHHSASVAGPALALACQPEGGPDHHRRFFCIPTLFWNRKLDAPEGISGEL